MQRLRTSSGADSLPTTGHVPRATAGRWRMLGGAPLAAVATAYLAACGVAVAPEAPGPEPVAKAVSFSVLEDYDKGADLTEVAADFRLMQELEVDTWRGSWGWDDYEPEPGRYDFAWLHRFAELAEAHGIVLRPYIAYTAPWAARGGTDDQYWNDPPRDVDAWARFVDTLVTAMAVHPNVLSYEIYNEQNVPLWWDGTRAEFAEVLIRGAAAVRAADPDAEVIVGGLVWPDAGWMEEICVDHGAASSFDIAPFHAYVETWFPPEQTVENFLGPDYRESYVATLREACGAQPVWINELGFATTPGNTETDQARWWVRAVATFLAEPSVEHLGIYEIKDLPTDRPVIGDPVNYHLGITYADRRKKLAFHTLDLLTDLLDVGTLVVADRELAVRVVAGTAGDVYRHLFRRPDGTQVLFVWDRTGSPTLELRLATPGRAAVEYALDGAATRYAAFDGRTLRGVRLEPDAPRIFAIEP
ncbi:MAG TPA: beta-galactosidase [Longimicrobiales bacterium]